MKTLTLSALLCAMMALTRAAALPDAEDGPGTEGSAVQESHVVKRATVCPNDWTPFNGRCYLFVQQPMIWALAERNCHSLGGNLASVQNSKESGVIQAVMTLSNTQNQIVAWLGGSDAQQEGHWFWSDGTPFHFGQWCPGQPDNAGGRQNCVVFNFRDAKCWDDAACDVQYPSICVREE
ncbi:ladderlectin-like isoform X2 [Micropterus salmoides]|uniref:ladderlectin-like isoform X2 n=1 Tax=Micropterus salmoides TaxID=27706 RepID=UPI0018EA8A4F|nr:ladderlectin-like isoform X2 [Micropterus salmoides]